MKNWKKYAFASASVVALAAGLAACGNLSGNSKKAADSASGEKTVIKMYQIGDKPDNLDELLENANKIIGEKLVLNWISNILDGVTMIRKCQLSHHLGSKCFI